MKKTLGAVLSVFMLLLTTGTTGAQKLAQQDIPTTMAASKDGGDCRIVLYDEDCDCLIEIEVDCPE